jgi:hypothetical protein
MGQIKQSVVGTSSIGSKIFKTIIDEDDMPGVTVE